MLKFVFVSNYLNHHQIPFCNAMQKLLGDEFVFIQTEPMEEERLQMGWQKPEDIPYLRLYYEKPEECQEVIDSAKMVFFGGTDEEAYIVNRLRDRKPVVRYSERMYKTGQWKAVSPRGLRKKYQDHTRYRKDSVYLMCSGAYVPSDFHIVRAYPQKMFCWGYFPETKHYDVDKLLESKGYPSCAEKARGDGQAQGDGQESGQRIPYILWAGRFIDWKHPELAVQTAKHLKDQGLTFHMDIIGGGAMEETIKKMVQDLQLEDCVSLLGFLPPAEVRKYMEQANIYLFTSDRNEGWGAVANEAMNSGCALVADHMIGAVPYLIRQGYNGYAYRDGDARVLFETVEKLVKDNQLCKELGTHAYETITKEWNAENAAQKLLEFVERVLSMEELAKDGPVSVMKKKTSHSLGNPTPCAPAPVISERRMWREITERIHAR